MAWVENDLLGYINTDNIVSLSKVKAKESNLSHAVRTTNYYFLVITNKGSIPSANYDTELEATNARTALISALGI